MHQRLGMNRLAILASLAFALPALLASSAAHAQTGGLDRPPFESSRPAAQPEAKSPGAAAAYAALPAAIGTTIAVAGLWHGETTAYVGLGVLTFGPSLGHFYAGAPGRGLTTMALRTAGSVALVAGLKSLSWEICG